MGKQREINDSVCFYDEIVQIAIEGIELDDEYFEQFQPRNKSRRNRKRSRDARRRIEEYWEDRRLAERLDEYYLHPED